MAQEIEITIHADDLGRPEREFGINDDDLKLFAKDGNTPSVRVFVDGQLVDPTKATDKSITVKWPSGFEGGTSTIVVTTKRDKILNVLRYEGNQQIAIEDPADDETTLTNIAEAIKRIADVMARPSAATPSGVPAQPKKDR
jgi:hypothetical protein